MPNLKQFLKLTKEKTMNNNQTQPTNQRNPNRFQLKTWQWVSVLVVVAVIVGGVGIFFLFFKGPLSPLNPFCYWRWHEVKEEMDQNLGCKTDRDCTALSCGCYGPKAMKIFNNFNRYCDMPKYRCVIPTCQCIDEKCKVATTTNRPEKRPSNISAYIYSLYLDALKGNTKIKEQGEIIDLTNLLCSIETTHKLSLDEEKELEGLDVNIVRYTGYRHHYYISKFSVLIIPELSKLEFVKDVRSAWQAPTLEGGGDERLEPPQRETMNYTTKKEKIGQKSCPI